MQKGSKWECNSCTRFESIKCKIAATLCKGHFAITLLYQYIVGHGEWAPGYEGVVKTVTYRGVCAEKVIKTCSADCCYRG